MQGHTADPEDVRVHLDAEPPISHKVLQPDREPLGDRNFGVSAESHPLEFALHQRKGAAAAGELSQGQPKKGQKGIISDLGRWFRRRKKSCYGPPQTTSPDKSHPATGSWERQRQRENPPPGVARDLEGTPGDARASSKSLPEDPEMGPRSFPAADYTPSIVAYAAADVDFANRGPPSPLLPIGAGDDEGYAGEGTSNGEGDAQAALRQEVLGRKGEWDEAASPEPAARRGSSPPPSRSPSPHPAPPADRLYVQELEAQVASLRSTLRQWAEPVPGSPAPRDPPSTPASAASLFSRAVRTPGSAATSVDAPVIVVVADGMESPSPHLSATDYIQHLEAQVREVTELLQVEREVHSAAVEEACMAAAAHTRHAAALSTRVDEAEAEVVAEWLRSALSSVDAAAEGEVDGSPGGGAGDTAGAREGDPSAASLASVFLQLESARRERDALAAMISEMEQAAAAHRHEVESARAEARAQEAAARQEKEALAAALQQARQEKEALVAAIKQLEEARAEREEISRAKSRLEESRRRPPPQEEAAQPTVLEAPAALEAPQPAALEAAKLTALRREVEGEIHRRREKDAEEQGGAQPAAAATMPPAGSHDAHGGEGITQDGEPASEGSSGGVRGEELEPPALGSDDDEDTAPSISQIMSPLYRHGTAGRTARDAPPPPRCAPASASRVGGTRVAPGPASPAPGRSTPAAARGAASRKAPSLLQSPRPKKTPAPAAASPGVRRSLEKTHAAASPGVRRSLAVGGVSSPEPKPKARQPVWMATTASSLAKAAAAAEQVRTTGGGPNRRR